MPKINTETNPSLEEILAEIGDSSAKSLRGGSRSLSAKTGITARLGSLWDRLTKREEDKAQKAEAALAAAYVKSTNGIEPTAAQKELISNIVRGKHPEGAKAGMELLKQDADAKNAELRPLREQNAAKRQEMDEILEQLNDCKTSEEVSTHLAKLARLQKEVTKLEGDLKIKDIHKNDVAEQNRQVLEKIEQNQHLQGADKIGAVAMAKIPVLCTKEDTQLVMDGAKEMTAAQEMIQDIKNNNGLTENEKIKVLQSVTKHASKVACINSNNIGDLARGNGPYEKFLSSIAQSELKDLAEDITNSVVAELEKVDALAMMGERSKLPEPGSSESQEQKGLEQAYQDLAVLGLQKVADGGEKLSPQGKDFMQAVKEGAMDAASIRPELLQNKATPEEMGDQMVQAQVVLRVVNPAISSQIIQLRASKDPAQAAKGQFLLGVSQVLQGYDNCMNKEKPETRPDGHWTKPQNATIDAIRRNDPELLKKYREAGAKYAGNAKAADLSLKGPSPEVQNMPANDMKADSSHDIQAEGEIEVKPKRLSVGDSLKHPASAHSHKTDSPELPANKPEKEVEPEKMSFQQKRAFFSR